MSLPASCSLHRLVFPGQMATLCSTCTDFPFAPRARQARCAACFVAFAPAAGAFLLLILAWKSPFRHSDLRRKLLFPPPSPSVNLSYFYSLLSPNYSLKVSRLNISLFSIFLYCCHESRDLSYLFTAVSQNVYWQLRLVQGWRMISE